MANIDKEGIEKRIEILNLELDIAKKINDEVKISEIEKEIFILKTIVKHLYHTTYVPDIW